MPDEAVLREAEGISQRVARAFTVGKGRAIVVRAGAGAGKTGLVIEATAAAAEAGLKVVVAAPTNAQVQALVRRCAASRPKLSVAYFHKKGIIPAPEIVALPNVTSTQREDEACEASIIVSTMHKLAFSAEKLGAFDRLILDEAFQSDSTQYLCVARLAPVHMTVGDPGQLDPFSTVDLTRWRGQPEDPLLTSIGVLLRNHPNTPVEQLLLTRRLSPSAVAVVQPAFYQGLPFRPTSLAGERQLEVRVAAKGQDGRVADKVLDIAAAEGWAYLQLPERPILRDDPETAEAIAHLAGRLFERRARVRCEKHPDWEDLTPSDVAIVVSHNDQKDRVRATLDAAGLETLRVDTANRLQGLEFAVVIAWHPLTGLDELDEFHLDPGRLCVMLTRHRHACIVVGRIDDAESVRYQPPTTPAYLGRDTDPVLDGWEAHRHIFEKLSPFRVAA